VDATFDATEIELPTPVSKIQANLVPGTSESNASLPMMGKKELIASNCPQPQKIAVVS
jgi:hypothetical protein